MQQQPQSDPMTDAPRLDGLSPEEARRRLEADGPNLLPGNLPKSTWAIVRDVVTEPMFLMLLAGGAIYLALGDKAEAIFLLSFVLVVIGITLAQERKTQRALESLRELSAPRALVIRSGQEQRIAGRDVVCGDLLVLREGDRVAADARLLKGSVEVDESLLTGESVPIAKLPDDSTNLFASTVVTRGMAWAEVTALAQQTSVGRIGADLAATVEPVSALQQSSRTLVTRLGWGAFGLAVTQIGLNWLWDGHTLLESLLTGIALAMAIVPEEIPVILTVFLALGAWRIAQQKVLTRRVSAVEALGAITVLAVDKTGTLTQNRMAVAELTLEDQHFTPEGAQEMPELFHRLTEFAMLATPGDPFDPMEKAIQQFGHQWLEGTEHVHDGHVPEVEYPLSQDILAMTRVFTNADPQQHLLATKGAPEAVADLCHLEPARRDAIRLQVEAMAQRGLRVLGVACGRWDSATPDHAHPTSQHDFDFEFLGLIGLADPPRPEVAAALGECRQAGIRVIMMTGDHPATALAIARLVGLSQRPEVITGTEIESLQDEALKARLQQVDICARLAPHHKLRLVSLLRQGDAVVAMTGDGVNDAPALKAADVGIAMGQRGTDVARESAALVLLDDSFARIVAAIRQGRRIDDNIRKATRFVFAVHIPIIALALVPSLLNWPILLLPVHIVLLELLIDPACSIVFEAEPESEDVMTRPPRAVGDSPFAATYLLHATMQGTGLAAVLLLGQAWLTATLSSSDQARTLVFCALLVGVLLLIAANRNQTLPVWKNFRGGNPWLSRMGAAVGAMLTLVLAVPWLRNLMGLSMPPWQSWWMLLPMLLACVVWLEAMCRRTHPLSGI
ncbi:cation-translocating P-type ATPase [Rhodoferax sp. GW822-FHT02A01]|uniref:cation-translocating P-type ATPase n=1 Tax=Rhodoferax sp. GW822-FHT02A01 TaxID=3141537 RepID=UPI00315D55B2